ncbi:MAG: hypothetical protein ACYTX0_15605 [Nostoc sp.]
MYLVNTTDCVIKLVWIYSDEQFAKRPTEVDLKSVFKEILDYFNFLDSSKTFNYIKLALKINPPGDRRKI